MSLEFSLPLFSCPYLTTHDPFTFGFAELTEFTFYSVTITNTSELCLWVDFKNRANFFDNNILLYKYFLQTSGGHE